MKSMKIHPAAILKYLGVNVKLTTSRQVGTNVIYKLDIILDDELVQNSWTEKEILKLIRLTYKNHTFSDISELEWNEA
jgi:hypothetical protein